jgi:Skp family chaperone for outer membrane proteins
MKISTSLVTKFAALSVLVSSASVPAFAAGAAATISVKIGYFNLALVKASYPEAAGSETLRVQAENQLRRDVEEGNKRLQKAQEDKKPKEELEKMAQQLQTEINAKQRALIELVQTQKQIADQTIATAVAQVAKEKSLDLVVDGAGVFSGGDKIVSSGEDITDSIVKKLTPNGSNVIRSGGGSSSGSSTTPPAATPAKK